MRHFLSGISVLIDKGETQKVQKYIEKLIDSTDKTVSHRYCEDETVNMILSNYETTISKNDIDLRCKLQIPDKLPISEVDITSILSNAIENAIHAVLPLDKENRIIELTITEKNEKTLISVSNTYGERPKMVDSMPITNDKKHGFGTQSIRYTVENLNGYCRFSVSDDRFILQIII